jgi:carboxymethylenebutenolidase
MTEAGGTALARAVPMIRYIAAAAAFMLSCHVAWAGEPIEKHLEIRGPHSTMSSALFMPDTAGPHPAILLLETAFGQDPSDLSHCRRLAREGYVCLVPDYIKAHSISGSFDGPSVALGPDAPNIYQDLVQALHLLKGLPGVRADKVGAVGFSCGAYFAIWLAVEREVAAGVSYYPALGPTSHPGHLRRFVADMSPQSAPLLIFHGTTDHIPVKAVAGLGMTLRNHGAPHEIHIYKYAGHEFERTSNQPGNQAAAADAQQRTDAFLGTHLQ